MCWKCLKGLFEDFGSGLPTTNGFTQKMLRINFGDFKNLRVLKILRILMTNWQKQTDSSQDVFPPSTSNPAGNSYNFDFNFGNKEIPPKIFSHQQHVKKNVKNCQIFQKLSKIVKFVKNCQKLSNLSKIVKMLFRSSLW